MVVAGPTVRMNVQLGSLLKDCLSCPRLTDSPWCDLDAEATAFLSNAKVCRPYIPGQALYHHGDPCHGLYCVLTGTVVVRRSNADGASVIVRIAGAGDILGYRTFFAEEPYPDRAEALTAATVCFITREAVQYLMDGYPDIARRFLRRMACDQSEVQERLLQNAACSVRDRVVRLLYALKYRYGTACKDGSLEIRLPIGRKDIAEMIGSCAESVIRAMRSLEAEELAVFKARLVVIADPVELFSPLEQELAR